MSKETEKTLKEQLEQLDELITWFDQSDFDLDEALKRFDDGMKLADLIKKRLAESENKVVVLKERFDQPIGPE